MEVKEIKKLIDLMIKNDLRELEICDGDSSVSLKRGPGEAVPTVALSQVQPLSLAATSAPGQPASSNNPTEQGPASATAQEQEYESIVSPMVGTFYHASNPGSDPFVQPGDAVNADTVVCVVEAMKVMNEIKAGLTGTIEKVMVSNGEAVEFGQPMFQVRPA